MATDIIDRKIEVGDYVVFYGNIYIVKKVPEKERANGGTPIRIKLADPSPTTRSTIKDSKQMCLINKDDVLLWLLKKSH
jgi:hypothetical protein